jgi:threonine dehydrogenase-like Zn-dependent dehydrogenase
VSSSAATVRAPVLRGVGDVVLEERPVPLARPGQVVALVAAGRIDLDRLVTGTSTFGEAAHALTAARRDPHSVKVVVHPQS